MEKLQLCFSGDLPKPVSLPWQDLLVSLKDLLGFNGRKLRWMLSDLIVISRNPSSEIFPFNQ